MSVWASRWAGGGAWAAGCAVAGGGALVGGAVACRAQHPTMVAARRAPLETWPGAVGAQGSWAQALLGFVRTNIFPV